MISVFVVLLTLALLLSVALLRAKQKQHRRRKQQTGLTLLLSLKNLLSLFQQHRGLTGGFLNGATELTTKIQRLQSQIDRDLKQTAKHSLWLPENARWCSITDHWQRLQKGFQQLHSADNIKQHNAMIQSLLFVIDDMALAHDLLLVECDGRSLVHAWRELLVAAECIGQLRATGTAVAASGRCDAVARIRLNYLMQKIEAATGLAWQVLPPDKEQRTRLAELNQYVRLTLINQNEAANAENYFGLATRAIDGVYEQFDHLLHSLPGR